jgi:16S rRNA processing protein RimM
MIQRSEVVSIGRLYKTHGISGELAFEGTSHYREEGTSPYWIVDVEGILVPFFLESIRYKSDQTAFVCFQGITSEKQAEELVGCEVFYPVAYLPENSLVKNSTPLLIGYTVVDQALGELGG